MAVTNFAALQPQQAVVWAREVWEQARDLMYMNRFVGDSENHVIQRITELTRTEAGEKALITLLADLVGDGVVGDDEREGNEEAMQTYSDAITIDLISHGVRNKGKLAEQKSVVKFRKHARSRLAYWLADRIDQLIMLMLSGIGYQYNLDGSPRASLAFSKLAFAADVRPPSPLRSINWTGTALTAGDTTQVTPAFLPSYRMLVEAHAYAKDTFLPPLVAEGKEYYVVFLRPGSLAKLKQDKDFLAAVTTALPRSDKNPFFTGATTTVDGLVLHELRRVWHNRKAPDGQRWGGDGKVNGTRTLLCGAQAGGMVDLGPPEWNEKSFNYGAQSGINVDKMFGLLKPRFYHPDSKQSEDFGVLTINHAL